MKIHPTAIISKKARIGADVKVGPYAIIKDGVSIGSGSEIGAFCLIEGDTTIGKRCRIFTGAVLGSIPQDLKYKGEKSSLKIGDDNIIREYVTMNPGTVASYETVIGDRNLFMAYSHVAHDCVVGNDCIIANNGTLAGHVVVEDKAILGGLSAAHQFVRIGTLAIVGGCSKVVQDVPPFATCDGHPAKVYGLNTLGLERHRIAEESRLALKKAFKLLFFSKLTTATALKRIEKEIEPCPELARLIEFVKSSKRGLAR